MELNALYTLCGALYHVMRTYNENQMYGRDWENFASQLNIDPATVIYSIQYDTTGFTFESKQVSFKYHHHDFHSERKIEFK